MLYAFSAIEPGEVSASAGERIKVAMDMGDWLQIINAAGVCVCACACVWLSVCVCVSLCVFVRVSLVAECKQMLHTHFFTHTGAQGLVPASYVRMEDAADTSSVDGSVHTHTHALKCTCSFILLHTGAQGLVPASYVRVEDAADTSSVDGSVHSSRRSVSKTPEPVSIIYRN